MVYSEQVDDIALLRAYAAQGDKEALGEFFRRHADLAYRMAFRVLQNATEAEDAVQAAFLNIMRLAPSYRGGEGVKTWVVKVVVNTSRNMIRRAVRRRGREEYVAEERGTIEEAGADPADDLTRQVKALLEELPEKYRMPIWLHHYEGLAFHEVAESLNVAEGTVRSQVSRGMDMLRAALDRSRKPVTAAALVGLLASLPAEAAPVTLAAQLETLLVAGAAGGTGAGVAGGSGVAAATAAKGMLFGKAAGLVGAATGSVVLMSAALYLLRQDQTASAPAGLPVPSSMRPSQPPESTAPESAGQGGSGAAIDSGIVPPALEYRWDFDSGAMPAAIRTFRGNSRLVADGGVDHSGCLEIGDALFEALLDVPLDRLPVLVSYQRAFGMPVPELGHMTSLYWIGYGPSALFKGMIEVPTESPPRGGDFSAWRESRHYVTRQYVDSWTDSFHHSLTVGEPVGNIRLRLVVRGRHRIDNLVIRSIAPEELPDVSAYLKALARVPPDKRTGSVVLPELRPGRFHSQVSVEFAPARVMDPAVTARANGLPWPGANPP